MTRTELLDYLARELHVDIDGLDDESLLFSTGIVDSFALVTLIGHLEEKGGFRMNPADVTLENLDSVSRILAFVERQTAVG